MDDATSEKKPGAKPAAPKNPAQVEFSRYKARMASPQPESGAMGAPFAAPGGFPGFGPGPAWAFPPSVAPLPHAPAGPFIGPAVLGPAMSATGSLGERLGTTLSLGLDLLNAGLAGSIRLLSGLSGVASGLGAGMWSEPYHEGCGCGGSCSCHGYAQHDCCCVMGGSCDCHPSVGTCC
jgi:hypothetical protein